MQILFDARSVRTPAGAYVFQGLTAGWRDDGRVERVLAAIPPDFDRSLVLPGVESVVVASGNWVSHITNHLPRAAQAGGVDVIFAPNAIAPRDSRSVLYFQDLFHFRQLVGDVNTLGNRVMQRARAAWRAVSLPTCRLAVTVSSEIFDEVRRRTSTRTVLIPNGIDIDSARWCGDEDVVLVMGGTGARKDEPTAVRAWAALRREVRGDTRCEVIGVAPEPRRRELIALAASLGVANSVDIVGMLPRDAFLERVSRARIAISCSLLEAFGLPVGEAIALGAPTLCSDIPAHVEILERAAAGASFRAGDSAALADQIERALQHAPPARLLAAPLGWGWRARASEHIDAYMESTSIPSGAETITDGSNHAERSTLHERRS